MNAEADRPLEGFTIGITAARRKEEFASLLERRGARVISAPSMRIVPLPDDSELLAATRRCLAEPVDLVVATTGVGFRGWLEAADGWGLAAALHERLAGASLLARGPKATGAIRAAGLAEAWAPASESSVDVLAHLLEQPLAGRRVAVQLHGEPQVDFCGALRDAGATVLEVPVYRWVLPEDVAPLRRLIDLITTGGLDALAFTSAPAVTSLLHYAATVDRESALVASLRGADMVSACVGPVCAIPLQRLGIEPLMPARSRLGSLVRVIADELPGLLTRRVSVGGHDLSLRGQVVRLDGQAVSLTPAPLAILRSLLAHPGAVLSRADLLAVLPGDSADGHAVEASIGRLRRAFGTADIVETVVKRGYRLAVAER